MPILVLLCSPKSKINEILFWIIENDLFNNLNLEFYIFQFTKIKYGTNY